MPINYNRVRPEEYMDTLYKTVKKHEGDVPAMYPDPKNGRASFGIGITPVVEVRRPDGSKTNVVDMNRVRFLEEQIGESTGNPNFKFNTEQMEKLEANARVLNSDLSDGEKRTANNKLLLKDPEGSHSDPNNSSFGIQLEPAQSENVNKAFLAKEEVVFDKHLQKGEYGIAEEIPPSPERAALRSAFHHSPSLIGENTKKAIKQGNRAAIHKEISKGMNEEQFPQRRQEEADLFGAPVSATTPPIPSNSPDGRSGGGNPEVGDPEVKRQNALTDDENAALDAGAQTADQVANNIMEPGRAVATRNGNLQAFETNKSQIQQLSRRIMADVELGDKPEIHQRVMTQRPDLFNDPQLMPGADTNNEVHIQGMVQQVKNERAKLGENADMVEMVTRTVQEQLPKIKFGVQPRVVGINPDAQAELDRSTGYQPPSLHDLFGKKWG